MEPNFKVKISQNIVIFSSLIIIFSALVYYCYALNLAGLAITVILSIISLIFLNKRHFFSFRTAGADKLKSSINKLKDFKSSGIVILFLIFWLLAILELIRSRSGRPLISPWEVVDGKFFFIYTISSLTLILAVLKKNLSAKAKLFLIAGHYFLSLAIAIIVYKVGYGFDPFIHQAAMEIIDKHGLITPKTPYYLGQYGFVIILHKLSGISIYAINKFLVPVAASLLLPGAIYRLSRSIWRTDDDSSSSSSLLATIFILTLSLPLFIVSTPQNFSYIFIILALASGLTRPQKIEALIFSLAAAAIHPLSGIPALIWSAWLLFKTYFYKLEIKTKKIISALVLSGGAILLPLALFISSGSQLQDLKLNLKTIGSAMSDIFNLGGAGQENWLLNLSYFIFYNYKVLIVILIVAGLTIFYRSPKSRLTEDQNHLWRGLLSINASLIIAFILSAQVNFGQVIAYEQGGYSRRILNIIAIFFLPFILLAISVIIKKIREQKESFTKFIWLTISLIFISVSLYAAYPRFDKYFNSRGYSTSNFDLEAVQKIASGSQADYIVLANQQVSAAALNLLGFNHYFKSAQGEDIYFYPIPTGGTLYQYFLSMVYKNPDRKTMIDAMDLVGTNEAYLVINKYWNDSGKIIAAAKLTADSWSVIGNNETFIFQYKR